MRGLDNRYMCDYIFYADYLCSTHYLSLPCSIIYLTPAPLSTSPLLHYLPHPCSIIYLTPAPLSTSPLLHYLPHPCSIIYLTPAPLSTSPLLHYLPHPCSITLCLDACISIFCYLQVPQCVLLLLTGAIL